MLILWLKYSYSLVLYKRTERRDKTARSFNIEEDAFISKILWVHGRGS